MSAHELERVIASLSPEELQKFRSWFAEFDAAQWDRQIEEDSHAGRLDHLIENALKDHRAGRTTAL